MPRRRPSHARSGPRDVARTLDQLNKGGAARIVAIRGDAPLTQRLLAMGVMPGSRVRLVGVAPLGDPITIEGPAGRLSLRRVEAATVVVDETA